jgi:cytochrome oxidase Cu insertion factor (SCO1/SenC/PrrC family)
MRALIAMFSFTLLATSAMFAQDNPDRREGNPRERVNRQFDAGAPKLGEPLPDIAGLNEDGQQFRLSNPKGQYTVLVFGCLT